MNAPGFKAWLGWRRHSRWILAAAPETVVAAQQEKDQDQKNDESATAVTEIAEVATHASASSRIRGGAGGIDVPATRACSR